MLQGLKNQLVYVHRIPWRPENAEHANYKKEM